MDEEHHTANMKVSVLPEYVIWLLLSCQFLFPEWPNHEVCDLQGKPINPCVASCFYIQASEIQSTNHG